MMVDVDGVKRRLESVRERIESACMRAGRSVESVTLIAVTKTQPVEMLQALIDCGVTDLGENRVSEILDKTPFLQGEFTMHLIGHLQTNKVARVLPFVQMVQSVDRDRLIEYIERYVPPETRLPVLVEVNTTGEPSKHGCLPDDCRKIMERVAMSNKLVHAGLMTIGPLGAEEKQTREAFSLLRTLAERNSDIVARPHLSMGMSGDFEWAIEEGATMVRIGSILCGVRN